MLSGLKLTKKYGLYRYCTSSVTYPTTQSILFEKKGNVGIITLNRPKALNALNNEVMNEVIGVLAKANEDKEVRCMILTGSKKAFAAGADIKEMAEKNFTDLYRENLFSGWDDIKKFRKPLIAAVNGFALGGGCELAMYCDMIIAGEGAMFGQPEIKLGTIPGMGGTQRLTRAVGKSKAMEWILTGEMWDAQTAVSRVVPSDNLMEEAEKTATKIASMSQPITMLAKEAVQKAFETSLDEGVFLERRLFMSTFATTDKMEGMAAFVAKRKPDWKDE